MNLGVKYFVIRDVSMVSHNLSINQKSHSMVKSADLNRNQRRLGRTSWSYIKKIVFADIRADEKLYEMRSVPDVYVLCRQGNRLGL